MKEEPHIKQEPGREQGPGVQQDSGLDEIGLARRASRRRKIGGYLGSAVPTFSAPRGHRKMNPDDSEGAQRARMDERGEGGRGQPTPIKSTRPWGSMPHFEGPMTRGRRMNQKA
jgi:hypothetical protein